MTWPPPCLHLHLHPCLLSPLVPHPPLTHVVSSTQNAARSSHSHRHQSAELTHAKITQNSCLRSFTLENLPREICIAKQEKLKPTQAGGSSVSFRLVCKPTPRVVPEPGWLKSVLRKPPLCGPNLRACYFFPICSTLQLPWEEERAFCPLPSLTTQPPPVGFHTHNYRNGTAHCGGKSLGLDVR